jgi:hypothetical protein
MDTRDVTHLRYLADAIAARPEETDVFLKILLSVLNAPYPSKRSPDDPFIVWLQQVQKDIGSTPDHEQIRKIGEEYSASKRNMVRRTGEILLWGIRKKCQNGSI